MTRQAGGVSGVAPYTGAWIEMSVSPVAFAATAVAPYTGAWIEINSAPFSSSSCTSRSLHGSVD